VSKYQSQISVASICCKEKNEYIIIKRKLNIFFYIERQNFEFYFICIAIKFVEKYERLLFDILMYVLLFTSIFI